MEPAVQQQALDFLAKSNRLLIALPKSANVDALGSALALAAFLRKFEKQVDIFSETPPAESFSFLSGADQVKIAAALPKVFVISVDTASTKVAEFSYDSEDGKLKIFITPESGSFNAENVSTESEHEHYDAIVCLDVPSLESLAGLYEKNTELFFNTPKINIDNHVSNENYGTINLVDLTAVSTSEIVYDLMQAFNGGRIDADIATQLLAGIISETNSFQSPATTPKAFRHASELINIGARQQEITTELFKTRSFPMLKLLGRAMARIKSLDGGSVVFSVLTAQDIQKSDGTPQDIRKAIMELTKNVPDLKLFFLAVQQAPSESGPDANASAADEGAREEQGQQKHANQHIDLYIYAIPNIKISEVTNYFGGEILADSLGKAELLNVPLTAVEQQLKDALEKLKPRLGL